MVLTTTPVIHAPNCSQPFELMCEASDYVIDAVLSQFIEKQPHVICYSSRTLSDTQLNYFTIEKEFLLVIFALEKLRSYLIGSPILCILTM